MIEMAVNIKLFVVCFQATIGIDFLSKTMYLEDRTVSYSFFNSYLTLAVVAECCCFYPGC